MADRLTDEQIDWIAADGMRNVARAIENASRSASTPKAEPVAATEALPPAVEWEMLDGTEKTTDPEMAKNWAANVGARVVLHAATPPQEAPAVATGLHEAVLDTQPQVAEAVLWFMANGWQVTASHGLEGMTDEYRRENAWACKRTKAPYCTNEGWQTRWVGPTPHAALLASVKDLGVEFKDIEALAGRLTASAVAAEPECRACDDVCFAPKCMACDREYEPMSEEAAQPAAPEEPTEAQAALAEKVRADALEEAARQCEEVKAECERCAQGANTGMYDHQAQGAEICAEAIRSFSAATKAKQAAPAVPAELSDERIQHLWDTRVGEPTEKYPLTHADAVAFARAVLYAAAPAKEAVKPVTEHPDTARLDWLDKMNADLNKKFGTRYGWKLILSPNVVRLLSDAPGGAGHIGAIDLHDSETNGAQSCRAAIDAARLAGQTSTQEKTESPTPPTNHSWRAKALPWFT